MRGFVRPPSNRYTGCFADLPSKSHSAISTALIATIAMPLRPNAIVLRYMCCQRNSMSHGSAPMSSGLRYRSITCLVTSGDSAALPMPTSPLSVKISHDQPAVKRERAHRRLRQLGEMTSIGLVQKCGGSGTVLPFHCMTRVRISVIFICFVM